MNCWTVGECGLQHLLRFGKFGAVQLLTRSAHGGRAGSGLALHPLNKLNEFWHRVHSQQRKEPAIEGESLLVAAGARQVEELNGLCWEGVDQAGYPALSAGVDGCDVMLHLAPIGGVDVGREGHQAIAASLFGFASELHGMGG